MDVYTQIYYIYIYIYIYTYIYMCVYWTFNRCQWTWRKYMDYIPHSRFASHWQTNYNSLSHFESVMHGARKYQPRKYWGTSLPLCCFVTICLGSMISITRVSFHIMDSSWPFGSDESVVLYLLRYCKYLRILFI